MVDTTIRSAFVGVLCKIESTSGTDASPTGSSDAIPVEADSVSFTSPYKTDTSNEATGSLVAGAPLVLGQAVQVQFKSRLKGSGVTYSASVKPPLHAPLSICGKRGVFQAAVTTAVLTAGSANTATLGTGYTGTAQLYRGNPLSITAGVGVGALTYVTDYTAGKVATLPDTFSPILDTSSSIAIPGNWTYAGTSPANAAARATDQPTGTVYIYRDGKLYKFVGCAGTVDLDGANAKCGYASFTLTGIFAGESDASFPSMTIANQSAPLLLQGSAVSNAFAVNRLPLPISQWKISDSATVDSPDDPNSLSGFDPGVIGGRAPVLTCDPLETLVATRDTLGQISGGSIYTGIIRLGYTALNRVAIVLPRIQPVDRTLASRGQLSNENLSFRILNAATQDSNTRDGDYIITFS